MPKETQAAVNWAIGQGSEDPHDIVDRVREYFNDHGIGYDTFSYDDLVPYLENE